ncbi:MAG TPA: hypothetical protein DCM44_14020 [Pantoea sp.]|nr:hypothetical protein [Pantoea sp.]HAK35622.1 hypothetical protein [Pantoea sp.]
MPYVNLPVVDCARGANNVGGLFFIRKNSAVALKCLREIDNSCISNFRPGCNPQPAKCLNKHHVLRHCCVCVSFGKMTN